MYKKVQFLLKNYNSSQRTTEWYKNRYNSLTASDIAAALEANPYQTKLDLLRKKCAPLNTNYIETDATKWGTVYEDVAINIYENKYETKVHNLGLVSHRSIHWLKASPDGIMDNGKLIEIKCPLTRKINDIVPYQYWIQMQIQLEVTDLEECVFFQCKFKEYKNKAEYINDNQNIKGIRIDNKKNKYWCLEKYTVNIINRDKNWFNKVFKNLKIFWNDVQHYRKNGIEYLENTILRKRKRSEDDIKIINTNESNEIRSNYSNKRRRLDERKEYLIKDWSKWISVRDIKNYIINDPILDWFNNYGEINGFKKDKNFNIKFNNYIKNKNYNFESCIINSLSSKYILKKIANYGEEYSISKYNETIDAIKRGEPIIHNGLLHDIDRSIYTIVKLMIRLDYMNKIFNTKYMNCVSNKYCIIDINNISLNVDTDNIIRKSNNIKSKKAELILANNILSLIQGYKTEECYIIGKKLKDETNKITFNKNKINKIAILDIKKEIKLINKVENAISWVKDVKYNGSKWNINNPNRWELYPNMCNKNDTPWHNAKKKLAKDLKELTNIWNIGINFRKDMHHEGIFKWTDKNLVNYLTDDKKGFTIEKIIEINKSNDNKYYPNTRTNILKDIGSSFKKKLNIEFYVDYETAYSHSNKQSLIYMIGCGYIHKNKWKFNSYIADRLDKNSEEIILKDWLRDMYKIHKNNKYRIYHWSQAEVIHYRNAIDRYKINKRHLVHDQWFDLLKVFRAGPICIKGAFNFGLKSIAKGMYMNKMIKTKWEDSELDGMAAMTAALEANEKLLINERINRLIDDKNMNEIIKYNEIDCKVMWDILKYCRKKIFPNIIT